ncbi:MAG: lytic transglycosylase domain-containing protein [Bryobacteraceae bacterium]
MRVCFSRAACLFFLGSSLFAGTAPAPAQRRLTSVVRVDSHSGRLTRTVVVAPKPVVARVVSSAVPEAGSAGPGGDANLQQIVEDAARRNQVDPLLVHSVIQVESNYNASAVSPKGAQGLMQLIPATARRFGATNSFDVKENVEAGVKYLKYLNSLYPNDLRLTLAAYNAGEGAVAKYRNNIPPYRETEHYVFKVGEKYGSARRAAEQRRLAAAPSSEKTVAVERHFPVESYVDSGGQLHMRTVVPSEGMPQ